MVTAHIDNPGTANHTNTENRLNYSAYTLSDWSPPDLPGSQSIPEPQHNTHFEYAEPLTAVARMLDNVSNQSELYARLMDQTRSVTQQYINQSSKTWLSNYGTAAIDVQLDSHFNLQSGAFDLLIPVAGHLDQKTQSVWFLQPGIISNNRHHYDGRKFVHMGFGYRESDNRTLYGINVFYDHDLNKHHQRASIGAEYGIHNLTFSGNAYFPLSSWKSSTAVFNELNNSPMMARPAKGIDIAISGYIPNAPQFSINTQFQHFFGELVEVSDGHQPVKKPYQIYAGLGYQPIPLLSFNAGYSKERGGKDGLSAGINLIYYFDIPLTRQLAPREVGISNSLYAQLYKLPERNHNIRLEYREKKPEFTIQFSQTEYTLLEDSVSDINTWLVITGNSSDLSDIQFSGSAASLIRVANSNNMARGTLAYELNAPAYQQQLNATANHYTLVVTATLKNGRQLTTVPVDIIITPNKLLSQFTSSPDPAVADGDAFITVIATVTDTENNPLSGQQVEFVSAPPLITELLNNGFTNTQGEAMAKLGAEHAGTYRITASFHNQSKVLELLFSPKRTAYGNPDTASLLMTQQGSPALADGNALVLIAATLKDDDGNPVSDQVITFHDVPGVSITPLMETTDAGGQTLLEVRTVYAGTYPVIAEFNGQTQTLEVSFTGNPSTDQLLYTMDTSKTAIANGKDPITVTATVRDANGNPVTDQYIDVLPVAGLSITASSRMTDAHGQVQASATSTKAGKYTASAELNGIRKSIDVEFLPGPANKIQMLSIPDPVYANDSDTAEITAMVMDAFENAVPAALVTFITASGSEVTANPATVYTNDQGEAPAKMKSAIAGSIPITARTEAESSAIETTIDVQFIDGPPVNIAIESTTSDIYADNVSSGSIVAKVTDNEGRPVANVPVTFTLTGSSGANIKKNSPSKPALSTDSPSEVVETDSHGEANIAITNGTIGPSVIQGAINIAGTPSPITARGSVNFIPGPVASLALEAMSQPVSANGIAAHTVLVAAKDAKDRLVNGVPVTLSVLGEHVVLGDTDVTTNINGQAQTTLKATAGGDYPVTARATIPVTGTVIEANGSALFGSTPVITVDSPSEPLPVGTTYTLMVTVTDVAGNHYAGVDVTISAPADSGVTFLATASHTETIKSNSEGKALFNYGGTKAGSVTFTASTDVDNINQKFSINFIANIATATLTNPDSALVAIYNPAIADGQSDVQVFATLADAYGNRVEGQTITFQPVEGLTITPVNNTSVTDSSGRVGIRITATKAGIYTITAQYLNQTRTVDITFIANTATASLANAGSTITQTGSPAIANNVEAIDVIATLVDANGNPVAGETVIFPPVNHLNINQPVTTTNTNGHVTAMVTSTVADTYSVEAAYKGTTQSIPIIFDANLASAEVTSIVATGSPAIANGQDAVTVTATVTDANGNPISDQTLESPLVTDLTFTPNVGITNTNGQMTSKITTTKAASYSIPATINGKAKTLNVTFLAGPARNVVLTPVTDFIFANNSATADLVATVTDEYGNLVEGATVNFTVPADSGATLGKSQTTDAQGKTSVTVKSGKVGIVSIRAEITTQVAPYSQTKTTNIQFVPSNTITLADMSFPVAANYSTPHPAIATVRDSNGQPVDGVPVTFTIPSVFEASLSKATRTQTITINTDNTGRATAELISRQAGSIPVTASMPVLGSTPVSTMQSAQFYPLTVITLSLPAQLTDKPLLTGTEYTLTAWLHNTANTPINGTMITFTQVDGNSLVIGTGDSYSQWSNAQGIVTTTIKAMSSGTITVMAATWQTHSNITLTFEDPVAP